MPVQSTKWLFTDRFNIPKTPTFLFVRKGMPTCSKLEPVGYRTSARRLLAAGSCSWLHTAS